MGSARTNPIQPFIDRSEEGEYRVEYQEYDPMLPEVFNQVKRIVSEVLSSLIVEHVGSSAIPGVGGRNVLDIAIPVEEGEESEVRSVLCDIGFQESPFPHYLPLLVGRIEHRGKSYSLLLYIVSSHSALYREWLMFRDHMRADPEDARAYDAVKRETTRSGSVSGETYQVAKTPFLESIISRLRDS